MPRVKTDTTHGMGQEKGLGLGVMRGKIDFGNLINEKVWEAINKDLGEITDVHLTHHEGYTSITYKSNGVDKRIGISGNDIRPMLIGFTYYVEANNYNSKSYSAYY